MTEYITKIGGYPLADKKAREDIDTINVFKAKFEVVDDVASCDKTKAEIVQAITENKIMIFEYHKKLHSYYVVNETGTNVQVVFTDVGRTKNTIIMFQITSSNVYTQTIEIPILQIDDTVTSTDSTWSSEKISTQLQTIVDYGMPKIYMTSDRLGALNSKADGEANCECEIRIKGRIIKCYATGKVQGTTSATFPCKNFTIKFFEDEQHLIKKKIDVGWGEQSKYCFKKNWVDTTHTRNLSGARIAYDMVESRPNSAFKTSLQTAPRNGAVDGFPCKLYINGEFWGLYTWNIPKDDWMFNMDSDNPNHMVLCAEQNNNGNTVNDNVLRCEFRKEWDGSDGNSWSIEVGTYSESLKNSFNRCVNFVMNATDTEFHDNISDYFDLYSLIDYYLFTYFTCHYDGLAKNLLMATYDGVHWGACLYDMDSIYGATYNGASFLSATRKCPSEYQETNSLLWQRIEKCFINELKTRYAELRKGALSLGNIVTHVEEIHDLIQDRVFADDKAKWTSLPSQNTNTITRFRNFMKDRAVYVDECITSLSSTTSTTVPCTNLSLNTNNLSFTTEESQTLVATKTPTNTTDNIIWSVEPTGIVSINNGIITPITNGDCVVTATCGSQSATCNVNVNIEVTPVNPYVPTFNCPAGYTEIRIDENTDINIPVFPENPSGENGATHFEIVLPTTVTGLVFAPIGVGNKVNTIDEVLYRGVSPIYSSASWNGNNYFVVSLPTSEVGMTIESIKNWLATHNIVIYAKNSTSDNLLEGVVWTSNPTSSINNTTGEINDITGDAYRTITQIPYHSNATYTLENLDGATFTWRMIYVYDSNGILLRHNESTCDNGVATNTSYISPVNGNASYMLITVYPNNNASNNSPSTQLKLTVS